ncbi:hypothetical protein CHU95_08320 [Niveispirillum lacus]|uniref:Uncharacterized protein n=2 Tax=Niveispirillum lacus TaxID=1981099 RepID=A0A255Z2V7_9PROT|nr:hypothetical protein CHU95_08320 [Niveispirillum lacus]
MPALLETAAETDGTATGAEAPMATLVGGSGKSPVFSSRAVRDATVVTGTIESLNRFVDGQDVLDDLTWRLESLTPDQNNFLQLSAEPGLIQRAQARSEVLKGAKAAALRKLLADLATGAIPEPVNRTNPLSLPKTPIVPPLTSLQPRLPAGSADGAPAATVSSTPAPILGLANPPPPAAGAPSLTTAPPLVTRPIPPAPAKPAAPPTPPFVSPPPRLPVTPPRPDPVVAKVSEVKLTEPPPPAQISAPKMADAPTVVADSPATKPAAAEPNVAQDTAPPETKLPPPTRPSVAEVADPVPASVPPAVAKVPEPAPAADPPRKAQTMRADPMPPPVAAAPSVPRLDRHDAEARRARLLASLNDTLSSSEASP